MPARQLFDQNKNADVYKNADAAIVLGDDQLESGLLTKELKKLIDDEPRRQELMLNIHNFAKPKAAFDTAELIYKIYKRANTK
jgi:UDP-N-acetylglucosamine:LPS N-acetylglucosamine transferase